jgi:hypothetical protein
MSAALHIRSLCVAIAATAFFTFAAPARAQQPSANALALAKEFVELIDASRAFQSIPTAVIVQSAGTFLQSDPKLAKDLNEIAEALVVEFAPRRGEIPNEVIKLYATHFTESELKDLLTFYKSPTGKKLLTESQVILDEAVKKGEAWGLKLRDEVVVRIRAELKKRGHNI